jgi:hypothetical protein
LSSSRSITPRAARCPWGTRSPWFDDGIVLSRLRRNGGDYDLVDGTREVCTTGLPFPVTIDLPALTASRLTLPGLARPDN